LENRKSEPNASTLGLLTFFENPLTYFFQPPLYEETAKKDMDELKRLAIDVIIKFSEFDPTDLIVNSAELIANKLDHEEEVIKFLKQRSTKK